MAGRPAAAGRLGAFWQIFGFTTWILGKRNNSSAQPSGEGPPNYQPPARNSPIPGIIRKCIPTEIGTVNMRLFQVFCRKSRESGTVTLEFALMVPFFVLLVIGLIEFGHIWYVKHQLTIASREGARYASSHDWPKPVGWTPDINAVRNLVQDYLGAGFMDGYNVVIHTEGAGFTTGDTGADVTVRLMADQNITLLLHYLVPSLNGLALEAQTTMRIE